MSKKLNIYKRWGSFEKLDGIYKEVEMVRVYEMALQTLSQWLEVHVNPNITKLFFMSMSPTHERYLSLTDLFNTHDNAFLIFFFSL